MAGMTTLEVSTRQRTEMVDVTDRVRKVVEGSGVRAGVAVCFVPHTTAGITIQENADPDVTRDVLYKLAQLVPRDDAAYRHSEGNSDAHIKTSLVGTSQTVLIEDGRLVLGTWQAIYLCEFDGPRRRRLYVRCMGEGG